MSLPEPIRSAQNTHVQQVRKWLARPSLLRKDGVLLADGFHLVEEAFRAKLKPKVLYYDEGRDHPELTELLDRADEEACPLLPVVSRLFSSLSPTETPQGIVGIFERPAPIPFPPKGNVVVADGIGDPGNLGAISRSARAAGGAGLLTLAGSVDPYHPRALRAAMGATFGWSLLHAPILEEAKAATSDRSWLALSPSAEMSLTELDPSGSYCLVFGSEGTGLRPEVLEFIDQSVRIPISDSVESLGVAAAAAVSLFWLALNEPN